MFELLNDLPQYAQLAVSIGLTLGSVVAVLLFATLLAWRYIKTHEVSVLNGNHGVLIDDTYLAITRLSTKFDANEITSERRHESAQGQRRELFTLVRQNQTDIASERSRLTAVADRVQRFERQQDDHS